MHQNIDSIGTDLSKLKESWRTRKGPSVLQSMGSQELGHDQGTFPPRDQTCVSCVSCWQAGSLPTEKQKLNTTCTTLFMVTFFLTVKLWKKRSAINSRRTKWCHISMMDISSNHQSCLLTLPYPWTAGHQAPYYPSILEWVLPFPTQGIFHSQGCTWYTYDDNCLCYQG